MAPEKKKIDNTNKKTEYTYDGAGRLVKAEISGYASNLYYTNSYQYDNAGNRTFMQQETTWMPGMSSGEPYSLDSGISMQSDGYYYACTTTNYLYDKADRMTMYSEEFRDTSSEEVENTSTKIVRYVFDDAGNQISTVAEFLTSSEAGEIYGVTSGSYDSIVEVTVNEYNGLNQLVSTTNIKDGTRTFASYIYNGDGLRVQKTVDNVVTDYVYSGSYVIAETGKTYLRGLSYHAVIVSNEFYYYFCNSHGDVTGITNEGGNSVATYDYDEFGNLTEQTGNFDNDIRYSGEFLDSESENYYLRSRYYDPTVGRFTQQDSFLGVDDNPLSLNRYTYCHNNPISFVDPSGLWITSAGGHLFDFSEDTTELQNMTINCNLMYLGNGEISLSEFMRQMSEENITYTVVVNGNIDNSVDVRNSTESEYLSIEDIKNLVSVSEMFLNGYINENKYTSYNGIIVDKNKGGFIKNNIDSIAQVGLVVKINEEYIIESELDKARFAVSVYAKKEELSTMPNVFYALGEGMSVQEIDASIMLYFNGVMDKTNNTVVNTYASMSEGGQIYLEYFGGLIYDNYHDIDNKAVSEFRTGYWYTQVQEAQELDSQGLIRGKRLNVPLYNQLYNPGINGEAGSNLCWATSTAMLASYYLSQQTGVTDATDRTVMIAKSTGKVNYNQPGRMISTDRLSLGILMSQTEVSRALSSSKFVEAIEKGNPVGINYKRSNGEGHYTVGIGYARLQGGIAIEGENNMLVVMNDPWGGERGILNYGNIKYIDDCGSWEYSFYQNNRWSD